MEGKTIIHIAGYRSCSFFQKAANIAASLEHLFPARVEARINEFKDRDSYKEWLPSKHAQSPQTAKHTSSPMVWLNDDDFVGGCDDFIKYTKTTFHGSTPRVPPVEAVKTLPDNAPDGDYDYDLIVIGGGSGGLSCSKRAAELGKKVAVLDFVKPSPQGTKWGLGGTCVNVGCIPKKLMHQAALLGESLQDAKSFGWEVNPEAVNHNWENMVTAVQNHIGSLNFGYRVQLREKKVKYLNALGSFVDNHTVICVDKKGVESKVTARRFVIAVGGRPRPLSCPGGELAISSDDLFSLPKAPGKTLVVGASYVALECAGFLNALKMDVTVMVRSIFLRGFDQEMANKIGDYMASTGVKFIRQKVPQKLEKTSDGRIKVTWDGGEDVYDTVFVAVGRDADTAHIGLANAGVVAEKNGKFRTNMEQTNVPHIYAIGDVLEGNLELTPIAIQAGKMLANRLYGNSKEPMDYRNVCTTIFTPLEYGCVGYAEEDAREKFPNVEVYHTSFTPLEWFPAHERPDNVCFCKVIVDQDDNDKVLGLHFLGPNAGEVTQGFGVGMKLGMTFKDLEDTVGIHPTVAEELTTLTVSKSSGDSALKSGC